MRFPETAPLSPQASKELPPPEPELAPEPELPPEPGLPPEPVAVDPSLASSASPKPALQAIVELSVKASEQNKSGRAEPK